MARRPSFSRQNSTVHVHTINLPVSDSRPRASSSGRRRRASTSFASAPGSRRGSRSSTSASAFESARAPPASEVAVLDVENNEGDQMRFIQLPESTQTQAQETEAAQPPQRPQPQEERPERAQERARCQWRTASGAQCKRAASLHVDLIQGGKFMRLVPAPRGLQQCCALCTQHLLGALGLGGLGIAHLLWKRGFDDTTRDIYQGTMFLSFGRDLNLFRQIYEHIKTPEPEAPA